jgi:hypothetical protein
MKTNNNEYIIEMDNGFDNEDLEIILNKDYLGDITKAVLNNDNDKLEELITKGSTIFTKHKLCNGYLDRKYRSNHKTCIKSICYKTPVYYAFYMNYCLIKQLIYYLKELITRADDIKLIDECEILFRNISDIDCGCSIINKFNVKYDSNYCDYNRWNDIIMELIKSIIMEVIKRNNITENRIFTKEYTRI